jgi:hypothetical protein
MSLTRLSLSFVGVIGVIAALIAASLIWLLITDPVAVADSFSQGDVSPIFQALGSAIYDALKDVLGYL